jgi:hypothetical protein
MYLLICICIFKKIFVFVGWPAWSLSTLLLTRGTAPTCRTGSFPQPYVFVPTTSCGYLTTVGFHGLFNSYLIRYSCTCYNYLIYNFVPITVYVLLVCFRLHAWLSDTGIGVRVFRWTVHSSLLGWTAGDRRHTRSTSL